MYSHKYFTHAWIDYPVTDCLLTEALSVGKVTLCYCDSEDSEIANKTAAFTNVYRKTPCLIATRAQFPMV